MPWQTPSKSKALDGRVNDSRPRYLALLILTVAVFLVFWPVSRHEFLNYDDEVNVSANDLVVTPSAANFRAIWQQPYEDLYIPLTYTFWQLQAKLSSFFSTGDGWGLNPKVFHNTNLLFHLANVVLVFLIVGRLLQDVRAALAGALIFAVHPVQVEPVAWVTGFKDVFCGFWSLLAIWQYLRFRELSDGGIKRGQVHFGLMLLFMFCALLAKPGAASVPLIIALLDFWGNKRDWRQTLRVTAPLALITLPFIIATTRLQSAEQSTLLPAFGQRLLICGDTYSFYLSKVLLPATIGPYYGRTPEFVLAQGWLYGTGILPYLLLAWLMWKGSRQVQLAAGIFALAVLPVSGLIPFNFQTSSTVADRYLYTPMLGVALGMGWLGAAQRGGKVWRVVILGLIAIYGLRSMPLVHYWKDSISCSEYGLRGNPNSWVGHSLLGVALGKQGRHDEAYQHFAESLMILPTEHAYNNMAAIRESQGKQEVAAALYLQAIQLNPNFLIAYENLVRMLVRTETMDAGERMFAEAVSGNPNAATIHLYFGKALLNLNRFAAAIPYLEKAISLGALPGEAKSLLAEALAGAGR